MFSKSECWKMVAAAGQGVLFALALSGMARIVGMLLGTPVPPHVAGRLFFVTGLFASAFCVLVYTGTRKHTAPAASDSASRPTNSGP